MKLDSVENYGLECNLPEERIQFKIESSSRMFQILSSGIYQDKILAVIRELSCNAFDAHIAAGKREVPFSIKLPCALDPTFAVIDVGTGIDPLKIRETFWTYGASTKSNSNDYIGALGLGSKSPFAYTKSSFTVRNRYQGKEYIYLCFINEQGTPDGSHVGTVDTTEECGITVEFAVRNDDINVFAERCYEFFSTWDATLPTFVDRPNFKVSVPTKVVEGRTWYLRSRSEFNNGSIALMGNVPYPINSMSIPNISEDMLLFCSNPFIFKFSIGDINFASSREGLEYDESTCKKLIDAFKIARGEIIEKFHEKIFNSKNHIEFISKFATELEIFKQFFSLSYSNNVKDTNFTDSVYIKFLFNKHLDDTITFDGENYKFKNLCRGNFLRVAKGLSTFGLCGVVTQNNSIKLSPHSVIDISDLQVYTVKTSYETFSLQTGLKTQTEVEYTGNPAYKNSYTWVPVKVKKHRSRQTALVMAQLSNAIINPEHASVHTKVEFSVALCSKILIIVNDMSSVGQRRITAYIRENFLKDTRFLIAQNPDFKSDFHKLVKDVKAWAGSPKFGIEVNLISELEDFCLKAEAVSSPRDIIKVPVAWYGLANDTNAVFKKGVAPPKRFQYISGFQSRVNLSCATSFKLGDLIALPKVFYTTRDRAMKVLDVNDTPFALADCYKVEFLHGEGLDTVLLGDAEKLMVLNLSGAQVTYLTKKGVKLASIATTLAEAVMVVAKTKGIYEQYDEFTSLYKNSEYDYYSTTYQVLKAYSRSINAGSPLHFLFRVMDNYKAKEKIYETVRAQVKLLDSFVTRPATTHKPVNYNFKLIKKNYPLLEIILSRSGLVNYLKNSDFKLMVKYINDCDTELCNFSGDEISQIFESNVF